MAEPVPSRRGALHSRALRLPRGGLPDARDRRPGPCRRLPEAGHRLVDRVGERWLYLVYTGLARSEALPIVRGMHDHPWGWPIRLATAGLALVVLACLIFRRFALARAGAMLQVVLVLVGCGLALNPFLVPYGRTIENSAAPDVTLRLMLGALAAGALVLFPSIFILYWTFKTKPRRAGIIGREPGPWAECSLSSIAVPMDQSVVWRRARQFPPSSQCWWASLHIDATLFGCGYAALQLSATACRRKPTSPRVDVEDPEGVAIDEPSGSWRFQSSDPQPITGLPSTGCCWSPGWSRHCLCLGR